jgi:hypothetical protein
MTKFLHHPEIYKFSAVLCGINLICLVACLVIGYTSGTIVNAAALVFNLVTTFTNYALRDYRQKEADRRQADHRQQLIVMTVGK